MHVMELERRFLAKHLPQNLTQFSSIEIADSYLPADSIHPKIRLRKAGNVYNVTKKQPVSEEGADQSTEQTIILDNAEYQAFLQIPAKGVRKLRYQYPYQRQKGEVDLFLDDLKGLVVVDFEYTSLAGLQSFSMPDFCLAEITHDDNLAGGMLCGKRYKDIVPFLARYGYVKLNY